MSFRLYNCRNIISTNYCRFNVNGFSINNITRGFTRFKEFQINSAVPHNIRTSAVGRCLSTHPNPDTNNTSAYVPLMQYPEVTWPGLFHTFKCFLTYKFALPVLNEDFDMLEFLNGSRQAIYTVSGSLSREDYGSLDGLVLPEAIEILKKNISKMSDQQKREIELKQEEFFFSFPEDIIIRKGSDGSTVKVEIFIVSHLLRNWQDFNALEKVKSQSGIQWIESMQAIVADSKYVDHAIVCNYRFIREFGTADKPWLINVINQFKLSDVQR